jgi:4-hydroxy-tetrahydrodipicolinate synthase
MTHTSIFGLSAALVTPFRDDGAIDAGRLAAHAAWVLDNGCDSVTLFGTTGEGFSLGLGDREAMLAAVDLGQRFYAGVTATVVADAAEQARLALDAGSHGLLIAPPFYLKEPKDDGLYAWFSRTFEAIGGGLRGVILYNIPGQTAVPLSVDLVSHLRRGFPEAITGIKDSSGDWATTEAFLAAHGDLAVLIGDERLLARGIAGGAQGSICGFANFAPELLRPVIHEGRDDPRLAAAVDRLLAHPVLPAIKAMVAHRHGDPAYARTRPPLVDLEPGRAKTLAAAIDTLLADGQGHVAAR